MRNIHGGVSPYDQIAVVLLLMFGFVLSMGVVLVLFVISLRRRKRLAEQERTGEDDHFPSLTQFKIHPALLNRPLSWLAVKCRSPLSVQSVLGLSDPEPCSWWDGLVGTDDEKLFISPPVAGWVLVFGSELPSPSEDVDACFRFLLDLSRKLGHVQFFHASRALNHHAWVKVESGRVVRAYAWAGKTLWNQGAMTRAEKELGLICFGYTQLPELTEGGNSDAISANVDKVPMLAARWSVDPATVDDRFLEEKRGIAGKLSHHIH